MIVYKTMEEAKTKADVTCFRKQRCFVLVYEAQCVLYFTEAAVANGKGIMCNGNPQLAALLLCYALDVCAMWIGDRG